MRGLLKDRNRPLEHLYLATLESGVPSASPHLGGHWFGFTAGLPTFSSTAPNTAGQGFWRYRR
jgi:hypothetical protein